MLNRLLFLLRGTAQRRLGLRLLMAFILLASIGALAYGLTANWRELASYHWRIAVWPLVGAWALFAGTLALAIAAWRRILRALGANTTLWQDVRIYCTANLAHRLPTPVWFVAGRVLLAGDVGVPIAVTSMAVLYEWVVSFAAGVAVALLALPLVPSRALLPWQRLLSVGVAVGCLAVVVQPRVLTSLAKWVARRLGRETLTVPAVGYREMGCWVLLWMGAWLLSGIMYFLLAKAVYPLGAHVLLPATMIWAASGVIGRVAAFVPGGMLLREFSMAVLLSAYMPLSVAVVVAVLARVWAALNDFLWFVLVASLGDRMKHGGDSGPINPNG
jgi:uncharacterized membrane protein YbhN (UPF0104 family)